MIGRFWQKLWHSKEWYKPAGVLWLAIVVLFVLCLAVMAINKTIRIQSDVFKLLPNFLDNPTLLEHHKTLNDRLGNKVLIMLNGNNKDELDNATDQLVLAQKSSTLWTIEQTQSPQEFASVLFKYRTGLLDDVSAQYLAKQNYQGLIESSLLQAYSPAMPISEQMLKDDPFLLLPKYALQQATNQSSNGEFVVEIDGNYPTLSQSTDDGEQFYRLITFNLSKSPYDTVFQSQAVAWLDTTLADIEQSQNVKTSWTGTLAFANFGTTSAKNEISTIGLGSTIGVVLLVLFGFRSLRPMATEFVAVLVGSLMAFVLTHWLFGEIHLMTLVFGASLIGVSVDFSFYFMAMQSLYQKEDKDGFAVLMPLLPSLFIGLLTTLLAYGFLMATPLVAFRQIAVFSAVGLAAAWISSILLLPRLPALNAKPAYQSLQFLGKIREQVAPFAKKRLIIIVCSLALMAIGLGQLHFNDDIKNLQSTDKTLLDVDYAIKDKFSTNAGGQYFIITSPSLEQTRQAEQALLQQLVSLRQQGVIEGVQAVGQWVNPDAQASHIAKLQAIPKAVLEEYAKAIGLTMADMMHWQQSLTTLPRLKEKELAGHLLAELLLSDTARVVLVLGAGDEDEKVLKSLQNQQVHFIHPVQTLSQALAKHRQHAQALLLLAMLMLCAVVWFVYGRKSVLPVVLPVALALGLTFGIQGLLDIEPNLFSIMACFLVLGIGVDYALFYHHAQNSDRVVAMALFLSMVSTLLGFGLLSLSSTYAIFCFGITVLFGVGLSFVLATCLTTADPDYGK